MSSRPPASARSQRNRACIRAVAPTLWFVHLCHGTHVVNRHLLARLGQPNTKVVAVQSRQHESMRPVCRTFQLRKVGFKGSQVRLFREQTTNLIQHLALDEEAESAVMALWPFASSLRYVPAINVLLPSSSESGRHSLMACSRFKAPDDLVIWPAFGGAHPNELLAQVDQPGARNGKSRIASAAERMTPRSREVCAVKRHQTLHSQERSGSRLLEPRRVKNRRIRAHQPSFSFAGGGAAGAGSGVPARRFSP